MIKGNGGEKKKEMREMYDTVVYLLVLSTPDCVNSQEETDAEDGAEVAPR